MISTGNDIVALAATDPERTSRYRFYSRVLTRTESDLVPGTTLPFSTFVWLLWSIKESVYKYVSRSNPRLCFAPLKIPVGPLRFRDDFFEGQIRYAQVTLYSRSFIQDDTILSVVSEEKDFAFTRWGLHAIGDSDYANQSAFVRKFVVESLSTVVPGAELRIVRTSDGPPEVWDRERMLDIPISLAHHDRFVAWSYRLSANNCSYRKSAAN
jgi:phosphopantetheinyl transferase (holo-ACP synthase)